MRVVVSAVLPGSGDLNFLLQSDAKTNSNTHRRITRTTVLRQNIDATLPRLTATPGLRLMADLSVH